MVNAQPPDSSSTISSHTTHTSTPSKLSTSTSSGVRPPSLHQLAARINLSNSSTTSSSATTTTTATGAAPVTAATLAAAAVAPRPRLAASLLRTSGSSSSNPLNASSTTLDSLVVNAPSTRSGSPSTAMSTSPPKSNTPANDGVAGASSSLGAQGVVGGGGAGAGVGLGLAGVVGLDEGIGEPLTAENLKELNQENQPHSQPQSRPQSQDQSDQDSSPGQPTAQEAPLKLKQRMPMGYKGVPSLDAITARLVKTRTLSIDGSAKPPEPEPVDDPKTPGLKMKAPEHPLQFTWTIYHDMKPSVPFTPATGSLGSATPGGGAAAAPNSSLGPSFQLPNSLQSSQHAALDTSADYEAGLTVIGEFATVESFCRYFNWLKPPSKLERNSNYHLFKSGIKPMWEDPANADGGKWVLTMKNNPALLDRCWSWLCMALVGEELEEGDDICGAVVSLRSKVDRIQVWTRTKDEVEKLNRIGKMLVKLLDVSEADGIGLEFQYNTEDRPLPNKFLSIQALPASSYRSNFQPNSNPLGITSANNPTLPVGGAFANFGLGIGASTWKSPIKRTM